MLLTGIYAVYYERLQREIELYYIDNTHTLFAKSSLTEAYRRALFSV